MGLGFEFLDHSQWCSGTILWGRGGGSYLVPAIKPGCTRFNTLTSILSKPQKHFKCSQIFIVNKGNELIILDRLSI